VIIAIRNTVSEGINKVREFLGSPVIPRVAIPHADYVKWKEAYLGQHKRTPFEAQEKLGLAFCQEFKVHDIELSECTNRIYAETLILSRYVERYRTLN
jgi:hypothetical protein